MASKRQDEIKALRRSILELRQRLFMLEVSRNRGLHRLDHLAVERLIISGYKSPATKRLNRRQLEAFARAALDPTGPPLSEYLQSFRRGHGDLLRQSAAYRLSSALRASATAVLERRPIEHHEPCSQRRKRVRNMSDGRNSVRNNAA